MSENEGAEARDAEDATGGDARDAHPGDAQDADPTATDAAVDGDESAAEGATTGEAEEAEEPEEPEEPEEAVEADAELIERIAEAGPEKVADEVAALRARADEAERALAEREDRVAELEERVDDLESSLKRKQAEFQNYKKRMEKRREQERERATEDLVERLLDVRDSLQRALDQDEDTDIRDGVEATLRQFDQVLDRENVQPLEPDPGDEVDPRHHEVLMRVDADHPEGTVARVHRPGYEMADRVIRPAQVTVSDAGDEDEGEGGAGSEDGTDSEDGTGKANE